MDPIPHTAIEAKLFSTDMNYAVVGSKVDGVKDIYANNECIWVNPYDKKDFAERILEASRLTKEERQNMNESNKKSLPAFDYVQTIKEFLTRIKFI